ncbi:hypothetical protein HZH66_001521 [Vespula vulgaris]|uniref:Uncharacterized protein n=1 Tax=Vespula vulgaris TaxID=7454 RepID=A0A834NKQ5_VESVU|nr:hypothetical protein HZH66_001521 [Vespula vulgaris]
MRGARYREYPVLADRFPANNWKCKRNGPPCDSSIIESLISHSTHKHLRRSRVASSRGHGGVPLAALTDEFLYERNSPTSHHAIRESHGFWYIPLRVLEQPSGHYMSVGNRSSSSSSYSSSNSSSSNSNSSSNSSLDRPVWRHKQQRGGNYAKGRPRCFAAPEPKLSPTCASDSDFAAEISDNFRFQQPDPGTPDRTEPNRTEPNRTEPNRLDRPSYFSVSKQKRKLANKLSPPKMFPRIFSS